MEPDEESESDADEGCAEPAALVHHVDAHEDEQGVDRDVVLFPVSVAKDVQAAAVDE
jgi:hypothetical protein